MLSSCATVDGNVAMTTQTVTAIVSGEPTDIAAGDLAEALLRAGFSGDFILDNGPSIRNALAASGGVQIRDKKVIAALMSVQAGKLYVTSRERGTFVQSIRPVA